MAKIYTLRQIESINQETKAILNRFYTDSEGYIHRGQNNGRLFKYAKCSEVSLDLASISGASNVCQALNILNGQIEGNSVLINNNTILINSEIAKVKCFSVAMALAL